MRFLTQIIQEIMYASDTVLTNRHTHTRTDSSKTILLGGGGGITKIFCPYTLPRDRRCVCGRTICFHVACVNPFYLICNITIFRKVEFWPRPHPLSITRGLNPGFRTTIPFDILHIKRVNFDLRRIKDQTSLLRSKRKVNKIVTVISR